MSTAYGDILSKGAVQEYVEAAFFNVFLKSDGKTMLSLKELNSGLLLTNRQLVDHKDYFMGLLDFTGEIMKYGISHCSNFGKAAPNGPSITKIVTTIRLITQHIEHLTFYFCNIDKMIPGFNHKHKTIITSLYKMERLLYEQELKTRLDLFQEKLRKRKMRKRLRIMK